MKIDRTRAEGAYLTASPVRGTGVTLYLIERVNGNDTVSELTLTRDELESIIQQSKELL